MLAALENVFPFVPADSTVAVGAFLAGRGTLHAGVVFGVTWGCNVAGGVAVYWLARRYGRDFVTRPAGRRLLRPPVLAQIEAQYRRHGAYGIFLSRLLPVWRAVVAPFARLAGLSAPRALVPLALASGLWYGALTLAVAAVGTNFDAVVSLVSRVNRVLGVVALGALIFVGVRIARRLKGEPAMTSPSPDTSGIRVLPPLIYAGLFLLGYAVHRFVPLRLWGDPPPVARLVGWGLVAAGALLAASAVMLFRRAGTTPNPTRPTTALVLHGPYRFTRNPMYVGLALCYVGTALLVNSMWPLILLPALMVLVQRWVIAPEEAYLERKFGAEYRSYRTQVRRWL